VTIAVVKFVLMRLRAESFRVGDESELQRDIEELLLSAGVTHQREYALDARSRIDFLITGGIGLELKVGGSATRILAQLARYAKHDTINTLIIASTSHSVLALPSSVGGKPLHALHLRAWL
jgi:hypothetical protein